MEYKELKNKKVSELHNLLAETRDNIRELRFKDSNKQLKNVREIREGKKMIAKILTLLNNPTAKKVASAGKTEKTTSPKSK